MKGIKRYGPSQLRDTSSYGWPFSFYTMFSFFFIVAYYELLFTKTQFQPPGIECITQVNNNLTRNAHLHWIWDTPIHPLN